MKILLPVWSHVLSRGNGGLEEGESASGVGGVWYWPSVISGLLVLTSNRRPLLPECQ